MKPIGIVLLVIAIILVAAMIVLYFLGKKAQKKKEEQDEQMKAAAQTVTMLIIDKKRMKMKDAGLPSQVMEQANKLMQRAKLPIVKAKVGPRVMTLIADEQIYDDIPVKKEVKATVSGLYITGVRERTVPAPLTRLQPVLCGNEGFALAFSKASGLYQLFR